MVHRRHGLPDRRRRPGRPRLAAARGALAAADEAAAGRTAYALARPPGHHAYAARAGGHCYLNNAALAAERLRAQRRARVAVLDIDSHHGNGTQGIFWERDDVLFVSVHGDPAGYYPWYVGHADERGAGAGEGCNLQPAAAARQRRRGLACGAGRRLCARSSRFGADALVVSLGFDASEHEPLNFLSVSRPTGSPAPARRSARCALPAAIIQEGGYNTDAARPAAAAFPRRLRRMIARIAQLRLLRHRGRAGRGAGADLLRPARLPRGRAARQGGGRGARAGARGADRHGPVAAAASAC